MTSGSEATQTDGHLQVYIRLKPSIEKPSTIGIVDDRSLIFDPAKTGNQPDRASRRRINFPYTFDRVFDGQTTNLAIHETVTKPMVDATIDGFNCCVFAYGALGSGKTYTMLGAPPDIGVVQYASKEIFEKFAAVSESDPAPGELKVCFFEIYKEKVRDLLGIGQNFTRNSNKRLNTSSERHLTRQHLPPRNSIKLPVCGDPEDGALFVIPGLSYHTPHTADKLLELIEAGAANRCQQPTEASEESSRSHAIFQIVLTRQSRIPNSSEVDVAYELQSSKMSFIDLAPAQPVAKSSGDNQCEDRQVCDRKNKSLFALVKCIYALDPRKSQRRVPYSDSTLTTVIRDSLSGKYLSAMIATVSQRARHLSDTNKTLMHASQARYIRTNTTRNPKEMVEQLSETCIAQDRKESKSSSPHQQVKTEMDQLNDILIASHAIIDSQKEQTSMLLVGLEAMKGKFSHSRDRQFLDQSQRMPCSQRASSSQARQDEVPFVPAVSQSPALGQCPSGNQSPSTSFSSVSSCALDLSDVVADDEEELEDESRKGDDNT